LLAASTLPYKRSIKVASTASLHERFGHKLTQGNVLQERNRQLRHYLSNKRVMRGDMRRTSRTDANKTTGHAFAKINPGVTSTSDLVNKIMNVTTTTLPVQRVGYPRVFTT